MKSKEKKKGKRKDKKSGKVSEVSDVAEADSEHPIAIEDESNSAAKPKSKKTETNTSKTIPDMVNVTEKSQAVTGEAASFAPVKTLSAPTLSWLAFLDKGKENGTGPVASASTPPSPLVDLSEPQATAKNTSKSKRSTLRVSTKPTAATYSLPQEDAVTGGGGGQSSSTAVSKKDKKKLKSKTSKARDEALDEDLEEGPRDEHKMFAENLVGVISSAFLSLLTKTSDWLC